MHRRRLVIVVAVVVVGMTMVVRMTAIGMRVEFVVVDNTFTMGMWVTQ